jgi:hypothetical protein
MPLPRTAHAVGVAAVSVTMVLLTSCRSRLANDIAADGGEGAVATGHTPAADTLRGIIVESGPAPKTMLLLRPPTGESSVLRGREIALLRRVVGLDVMVEGRNTGERDATASPRGAAVFNVERFQVRGADGIAAHDGIVRVEGDLYWLSLQDGRKLAVRNLPAALRALPGARVFLAGPLDHPPASYGIIAEAR